MIGGFLVLGVMMFASGCRLMKFKVKEHLCLT